MTVKQSRLHQFFTWFDAVDDKVFHHKAALIILFGMLLALPSVFAGLFADDYSQALLAQQWFLPGTAELVPQPDTATIANLFTFVTPEIERRAQLINYSLLPWWTAKDLSMVFFRPLAELSHLFDYGVLKLPELMHLHSLLWYALVLLVLSLVFKRLLPTHLSLLALLFFVVDSTHAFTLAWLANRNALMALLFSLVALLAMDEYTKTQKYRYLTLLVISVFSAFLSAEAGIVSGVLLLAYALFYRANSSTVKQVIMPLLLAFMVFIIWFYFYQTQGFGASGNKAYYADPLAESAYYLENFPTRFLLAMSMLFNLLPFHFNPQWQTFSWLCGLLIFIALMMFTQRRNKPYLYFSAVLIVLSIIPIASAEMQERNLLFANVGASIFLADIAYCMFHYLKSQKSVGHYCAKAALYTVLIWHLVLSAVLFLPMSYAPALLAAPANKTVFALNDFVKSNKASNPHNQMIFTVGMPMFTSAFVIPMQVYSANNSQLLPKTWMSLSSNPHVELEWLNTEREAPLSFTLRTQTSLFSGPDTLLRDVLIEPFEVGEVLKLAAGQLTIIELSDKGEVLAIRLDLPNGVKKADVGVYRWKNSPNIHFEALE